MDISSDPQPVIKVYVYGHESDSKKVYFVHENYLRHHAPKLRSKLQNRALNDEATVKIRLRTPLIFGRFLAWIYKETLTDKDLQLVHQSEWIRLWILSGELGATHVQNEIIVLLEELRARDLFKILDSSFLKEVYDLPNLNHAISRYMVDTWDNRIQTISARDLPHALAIDLLDSHVLKGRVDTKAQINVENYLVFGEGVLDLSDTPVATLKAEEIQRLFAFYSLLEKSFAFKKEATNQQAIDWFRRGQAESSQEVNVIEIDTNVADMASPSTAQISQIGSANINNSLLYAPPRVFRDDSIPGRLMAMPKLREPEDLSRRELNLLKTNNYAAYVATAVGTIRSPACKRCQEGKGQWKECVTVAGHLLGSCGNCFYGGNGHKCSFRKLLPSVLGKGEC